MSKVRDFGQPDNDDRYFTKRNLKFVALAIIATYAMLAIAMAWAPWS